MNERRETYDWSKHDGPTSPVRAPAFPVEVDDETLRDGLQGTQLETHPSLEQKIQYLTAVACFVDHADIGFPGSERNHQREIIELIRYTEAKRLGITLSTAARGSVEADIKPIIDISHSLDGYPLEADIFLDASQDRAEVEGWNRDEKICQLVSNIKLLKQHRLPVMFVAERATSTSPDELLEVFKIAADLGVERVCIADTQGRAESRAISNLVRWSIAELGASYPELKFDGHFHNDRGLGVSNCLVAANEGVNRVHATTFCIGERAGNVDLTTLVVNLEQDGHREADLSGLVRFSQLASHILNFPIPSNAPIVGETAFATGSGVHASALKKESGINSATGIYFPFPPRTVGAEPKVRIGPFSGESNVVMVLNELGIEYDPKVVEAVLREAKQQRGLLPNDYVERIAERILNGRIRKISLKP